MTKSRGVGESVQTDSMRLKCTRVGSQVPRGLAGCRAWTARTVGATGLGSVGQFTLPIGNTSKYLEDAHPSEARLTKPAKESLTAEGKEEDFIRRRG